MFRFFEVKVPIEKASNRKELYKIVCDNLGVEEKDILDLKISKKSLDARNKKDIHYKFNFDLIVSDKAALKLSNNAKVKIINKTEEKIVRVNSNRKVLVVGSGPSGLFAALNLVQAGVKVVLLERGEPIEERVKTVDNLLKNGIFKENSNIQFGEGGAGTFSDGKLNTGINSPLIEQVIKTFYHYGAPEEILYDAKPHIGTDKLRNVVVNIRRKIESLGGIVLFNTTFTGFSEREDGLVAIYQKEGKEEKIIVDDIVLALGYSARDTLRAMYNQGIEFKQKPFSVGYRIEHLQEDINKAQYGSAYKEKELPPADYKLFAHLPNGRTVYTFCMCPGGVVVPPMSKNGQIVTNGMSYYARDGVNANSAILVSVGPEDYGSRSPLAGMDFQEKLEMRAFELGNRSFICSRVGDFLEGKKTTSLGKVKPSMTPKYNLGRVDNLLPKYAVESIKEGIVLFGKKLKGFDDRDAILTGIETRSSAPFMISRNSNLQTNIKNIYAVGEGAGMAGGIVSSAVDGIKIAKKIIDKYLEVECEIN